MVPHGAAVLVHNKQRDRASEQDSEEILTGLSREPTELPNR
ncbi:hypothetical protein AVEN_11121-1, partial [Araneus ventricosus]